jgi:hypothetical protein
MHVSDDLTVTQLTKGIWLLDLFVDEPSHEEIVQCDQTSLKLTSNIADGMVTLSLNEGKACETF